jgi:predicted nuclease with TOPRIM domain
MENDQNEKLDKIIEKLDQLLNRNWRIEYTLPNLPEEKMTQMTATLIRVEQKIDRTAENVEAMRQQLEANDKEKTSPVPLPAPHVQT